MPFIENFDEFRSRMKCDWISIKGRILFRNGGQSNGHTQHSPPPASELESLKLRYEFAAHELVRAESDFNTCRRRFLEQAELHERYRNLPAPPVEAPEVLRKLREIVVTRSEIVENLRSRIAVLSRDPRAERVAELDRRLSHQQAELRDEISAITLP